jgi:phosphatidylglycerol:prolipoprotein diacylglycerol transferase
MESMDAIAEPVRLIASALVYVLAYGCGLALFAWFARKRGLSTEGVRRIALAAVAGGLAGATALQLIVGGEPGRTILGGVAGGYLAVMLTKRLLGITRPLGDLFAVAIAGGEAVGRWGCFLAGCCYGRVAGVPWAVEDNGAFRHPTQIYASLAAAATLAILLVLERRARLPENALFYIQGSLLCASRFVIEFYREPSRGIGPLTFAQWACLAGLIFFIYRFARLMAPARPAARRFAPALT